MCYYFKINKLLIPALVLVCFTLASCTRESSKISENKNTPESTDKKQEPIVTKPSTDKSSSEIKEQSTPESAGNNSRSDVKFSQMTFKRTYKGCDENKDDCTNMQIYYPVISGSSYDDKVNSMIKDLALHTYPVEGTNFKDFDDLLNQFMKDFEDFKKEFPDAPGYWYLKDSTAIVYNSPEILSFENISSSYLGGAHGSYNAAYTNIDMRNGNMLKTKDIFNKGYEKTLNKMIEAQYRKQMNLKPNESLTEGGLFENKISFNDNFAMTKDGIEFLYNQYEIAPYAVGVIEIKLSYKDLDAILNKDVVKM